MIIKKPKRLVSEQAVLIEKKILNSHDKSKEIRNLYSMKLGTYNTNTSSKTENKVFSLIFMTKKGEITFYVDNKTYYDIKIDSLGILTRNKDMFVSFDFEKIATKEDVIRLDW